ncbi:uncharacterized protein LOC100575798 isoform X2 [Acyrthosiphon pisum]|uniref:THAP-type domain-containing protein n=1 Tax=Acyrthosiphon pisum TaxID=7029 RepID=A0A8R2B822_ACYPI|nr:uncharacterized protein LOC100575798 isoform X2 [Acyrthosiphon pisum]|eukprot:XP_008185755.1 PREDICTED: uncharacterized protein LOC100575798 isoform X2 [Acyrthosiphon pisum]
MEVDMNNLHAPRTIEYTTDGCAVPGCISNTDLVEDENISLFQPSIENVNEWSSSLNLNLTVNSYVCDRHFRPEHLLYPEVFVNGSMKVIKCRLNSALPIAMDAEE